jgi:DNA-binding YbaB/EbfC family protein
MSFNMKELNKLMKQAQKMQSEMMEQQSKLQTNIYEGTAGGGMVTIKVNGSMELVTITIRKDCIDPEDPEMLQDLVKAAFNEAIKKAKGDAEQSMSALTGGMKLPGM